MDFTRVSRRSIAPKFEGLEEYPHELQLYNNYPTNTITIDELEQCMAERLRVLQTLEEVGNRNLKSGSDEWRKTILDELKKLNMRGFCKLITATSLGSDMEDYQMRWKDHVSHYMLRVSYCGSEDKRRWFISREVELFKLRWLYLSESKKSLFLKQNNLNYEMANDEEKRSMVMQSRGYLTITQDYYRIPLWKVADLVRSRKVFINKGIAFITNDDIISVVLASYRSSIAQNLAYISRNMDFLDDDPRVQRLVRGAGKQTREVEYMNFTNKDRVDIRQLDTLAEISYPLCMRQLHQKLRSLHHLKHFARQQYGLFLKGIGVSLEDSLKFWRSELCKQMDLEKFEKSYSYNIRHNYGREGKRANYAPHTCMKIINASVVPGQLHGCPFKALDNVALTKVLQSNGFSLTDQREIADLAKKGHFQLACSSYFMHSHKNATEQVVVNHPNHYFDESQRILANKMIKKEEKGASSYIPKPTPVKSSESAKPTPAPQPDEWEDMCIDLSEVP